MLIVAAGFGGMAMVLLRGLDDIAQQLIRVVVPGEFPLHLDQPGTYSIFHEYSSTIDGRVYAVTSISGLFVEMRRPGGQLIELRSATSTNYSIAGNAGRALFEFEAPDAGTYRLRAGYPEGRREPQTVLSVGRGVVGDIVTTILTAVAMGVGGMMAALALAINTFIRRRKAREMDGLTAHAGGFIRK